MGNQVTMNVCCPQATHVFKTFLLNITSHEPHHFFCLGFLFVVWLIKTNAEFVVSLWHTYKSSQWYAFYFEMSFILKFSNLQKSLRDRQYNEYFYNLCPRITIYLNFTFLPRPHKDFFKLNQPFQPTHSAHGIFCL